MRVEGRDEEGNDRWCIELLGGLRAGPGDQALTPLPAQKATALLAYLAYFAPHPHPRETLIELLWPEVDPKAGRLNLRVALHTLRRLLEERGPAGDLLVAQRATVHLEPAAFTTDVAGFRAALQTAAGIEAPHPRAEALTQAVARYTGELLPGFFEPWVLAEREHLAGAYLAALQQLTQAREELGDLPGALATARQVVAVDPLREEAHYDVMRLYAATGQPSACLQQYEELERVLREELGETPSAEARALAEELQQNARRLVVARRALAEEDGATGQRGDGATEPISAPPVTPSPRRLVAPSVGLPLQLTRFFGREEEIARLTELLVSPITRVATITGPGGSGKTRLAVAVAGRLQEQFGEAVTFVPLADLTDPQRLTETIAAALGLAPGASLSPGAEPLVQVVEHLQRQPWLLVLDNFEQLVTETTSDAEGGAMQVRALLERVPTLTCLVTSRQRLGIGGEQEFVLLPLPTPRMRDEGWGMRDEKRTDPSRPSSLIPHPSSLMSYPSVRLFVDRARAVRPGFELTDACAEAVAELCDRLEGLPLALELAAARMRVLTPEQILARLSSRFELLESRQRDLPARHRSLRAAMDWSYQLLSPELQQFFARLSIFRGGWTLEAAEAVCGDARDEGWRMRDEERQARPVPPIPHPSSLIPDATLDCLEQLQESSLVVTEESPCTALRYRLLETVREYARERLMESGELNVVRDRHRDWYLQLAEQIAVVRHRPEHQQWLTRMEAELDNFRVALAWCFETVDSGQWRDTASAAEAGLRLSNALRGLWINRGYLAEAQQWTEGALARSREAPTPLRAAVLTGAAELASARGDPGRLTFWQQARREHERVLSLARANGDRREIAAALWGLAYVAASGGDDAAALRVCVEGRQLFEELGDPLGLAGMLSELSNIALRRGDRQAARPLFEARLAIFRKLGGTEALIHTLGGLGHIERDEGDYARARAFYQESLRLRQQLGHQFALAQSLEDFAVLAGREQQHERAIRLLGAEEAFCETLGARPPVADGVGYERTVAAGRAALGEAAFAAAWAEGRAMSLEQAVEYALAPA